MKCYIVTFDTESEETLKLIKQTLKSYNIYCPINRSCWAIKTDESAVQIRDKLMAILDDSDRIFVVRSGTEAAWYNSFGDKNDEWLKDNL